MASVDSTEDNALVITPTLSLPLREIEITAMRAQGPGGQNINKVSAAIEVRFDIGASSLPAPIRARLLARADRRITQEGVLRIKAQEHRTQPANRRAALERLAEMIRAAAPAPRTRRPTAPSRASRLRRLDDKTRRGRAKGLRRPPGEET
jgi:ribosome-associated protein